MPPGRLVAQAGRNPSCEGIGITNSAATKITLLREGEGRLLITPHSKSAS